MLKCEICGREFKEYKGLGYHISQTHKISTKDYYNKYLRTDKEGICLECGKETSFRGLKIRYSTYCSSQCVSKSSLSK